MLYLNFFSEGFVVFFVHAFVIDKKLGVKISCDTKNAIVDNIGFIILLTQNTLISS